MTPASVTPGFGVRAGEEDYAYQHRRLPYAAPAAAQKPGGVIEPRTPGVSGNSGVKNFPKVRADKKDATRQRGEPVRTGQFLLTFAIAVAVQEYSSVPSSPRRPVLLDDNPDFFYGLTCKEVMQKSSTFTHST